MDDATTFTGPEGTYSCSEEHKPTVPQSIYTANAPTQAQVFTKATSVVVHFPTLNKPSQSFSSLLNVGGNKADKKDKKHHPALPLVHDQDESVSSGDVAADDSTAAAATATAADIPPNPSPTDPPPQHQQLFSPTLGVTSPSHKRKPTTRSKQNLKTTTSSFVTRYHAIEGLNKHLAAKAGDTTFMFYNSAKTFYVTETDTGVKSKEPLIRITFNAWPTCHAVNQSTASSAGLDVIIGFHTGDLMWFDPLTTRYCRLNKQGCITNSPCTSVSWVPGSRNLFLVSHANGTIVVYDKEREDDTNFQPTLPSSTSDSDEIQKGGDAALTWNSLEEMWVTRPGSGAGDESGEKEREKEMAIAATKNPVSHWRVSRKGILDFAFSPDVRYVAVISEDGKLRIIDALNETLVDTYAAYFGILTCVAWSPDGRFIATGGQDDLVTIFSPHEQRVIARCQGHVSFVSSLAFDSLRCDGRTYRFASVGEDCKLILWDFSSGALHRPRAQQSLSQQHRLSISSQYSLSLRGGGPRASIDGAFSSADLPGPAFGYGFGGAPRTSASKYHPAPSRNEVAVVQPVVVKSMEGGDILSSVMVIPTAVLTATRTGCIKAWARPAPRVKGAGGRKRRAVMGGGDVSVGEDGAPVVRVMG